MSRIILPHLCAILHAILAILQKTQQEILRTGLFGLETYLTKTMRGHFIFGSRDILTDAPIYFFGRGSDSEVF